ncbi:MAG: isoprenylcysteine carboxylmethyltransferase family protein [Acidobacteriaceae bacterium]
MTWSKTARRIRGPLGFALAALFLLLARPTPRFLLYSLLLVVPGIALRAAASGHVKKNLELTISGPYAYTRNPLYLGSILIAVGFAVAAQSLWLAIALLIIFVLIYLPVIRSEEEFLRATFPSFDDYTATVPRLFPRLTSTGAPRAPGSFSPALYRKHREYNALIGSAALYAALIVKFWLETRTHI